MKQVIIIITAIIINKSPFVVGRDVRENHKDYNQVVLDVRRCMKRFPKGCAHILYDIQI